VKEEEEEEEKEEGEEEEEVEEEVNYSHPTDKCSVRLNSSGRMRTLAPVRMSSAPRRSLRVYNPNCIERKLRNVTLPLFAELLLLRWRMLLLLLLLLLLQGLPELPELPEFRWKHYSIRQRDAFPEEDCPMDKRRL